jgi:hypothetical protein
MADMSEEEFIGRAHSFMQALSQFYGAERGHEFWTQLAPIVGDDIQKQIFLRMLRGDSIGTTVRFMNMMTNAVPNSLAIPVIKALRQATGMSLKEAKAAWDDASRGYDVTVKCTDAGRARELAVELRGFGYAVERS